MVLALNVETHMQKQYHKYVSMLELTAKNHAARIMDRQTASK